MSQKTGKRRINSRDIMNFTTVTDPQTSPDGRRVAWVYTWTDIPANSYRSEIHLTDLAAGETQRFTAGPSDIHPRWSPDGSHLSYHSSGQLYVKPVSGGDGRPLTDFARGVRSHAWSPDGSRLAATTLVHPDKGLERTGDPEPDLEDDLYRKFNQDVMVITRLKYKVDGYGFVGDYRSHVVLVPFQGAGDTDAIPEPQLLTLGEFDLNVPSWSPDGQKLAVIGNVRPDADLSRRAWIYLLPLDEPRPVAPQEIFGLVDIRVANLAWAPDSQTIAVCGHNRKFIDHYGFQKVWLVSTAEGTGTCITEHLDVTFCDSSRNRDVRGLGGDGADGPRWLPDGSGLLLIVNEFGTGHLAHLEISSGELTRLTQGDFVITAFSGDRSMDNIIVLKEDDLNLSDIHSYHGTMNGPGSLKRLTDTNRGLLSEVELSVPERFTFQSDDVSVEGWLVPPLGREAGGKYPVILYGGGGAGSMRASVFVHEFQLLAAQGYGVIHCNARGNYGYGEDFSTCVRGRWGDLDYRDNMACIRAALERFDYLDPERVGAAGGSYGGFMTAWITGHHPEIKAAVVDRLLSNRYSMDGTSDIGWLLGQTEFDYQKPWEATEEFMKWSPIEHVGKVKTPTLVVHSEEDHRCPIEQGEQYYAALKRLGVPTEFVRFSNENHGLNRGGQPWHRVFRLDRYLDWFQRWL
ncbi:MAG: S9 family peptidase [Thermaerobacterales bacterium]